MRNSDGPSDVRVLNLRKYWEAKRNGEPTGRLWRATTHSAEMLEAIDKIEVEFGDTDQYERELAQAMAAVRRMEREHMDRLRNQLKAQKDEETALMKAEAAAGRARAEAAQAVRQQAASAQAERTAAVKALKERRAAERAQRMTKEAANRDAAFQAYYNHEANADNLELWERVAAAPGTGAEVAERFGVSLNSVYQYRSKAKQRAGKTSTPDTRIGLCRAIAEMKGTGAEVAKAFGVCTKTVYRARAVVKARSQAELEKQRQAGSTEGQNADDGAGVVRDPGVDSE